MVTMMRTAGVMASLTLGAYHVLGCVLSTFPSVALILTQLNEVSVIDPHCSDEETGHVPEITQLASNEVGWSQVLCAQSPCSPRPRSQMLVYALPGLPVQSVPEGRGTTPRSPAPNISCNRTW